MARKLHGIEISIRRALNESIREFLLESSSMYRKKMENRIRELVPSVTVNGKAYKLDDVVPDSDWYVNANPNTTFFDYLVYHLRHDLDLMNNSDVAMLENAAKIAFGELHMEKLADFHNEETAEERKEIQKQLLFFIEMLNKVKQDQAAKLAFRKDDVTFESLYATYGEEIEAERAAMEERMRGKQYTKNENYEIIRIDDYETANEWGKWTGDNGDGKLCYTTSKKTWNDYTHYGMHTCYLCLRNDFRETPCQRTDGYPKDSYGLSMVFLFVNPEGNISNSNVRWNHGNGSYDCVDHMFTKEAISDLVGVDFDSVFKPMKSWREIVGEAIERVQNGASLYSVFDYISDLGDDFKIVTLNGRHILIGEDLDLVYPPNVWFDKLGQYSNDECAIVGKNNKWNAINAQGAIIYKPNDIDEWFDYVGEFENGVGKIKKNGKLNIIRTNGVISYQPDNPDEWFDSVDDFCEGLAKVEKNGKYNFINEKGFILYRPDSPDEWFDYVSDFNGESLTVVSKNGKYNILTSEGVILYQPDNANEWLDMVDDFDDGFAKVKKNGKYNFINERGFIIYQPDNPNEWFDWTDDFFQNGFAKVKKNGDFFRLRENGILCDGMPEDGKCIRVRDFYDGFAIVKKYNKYNYVNKNGVILYKPDNFNEWFDTASNFHEGFAKVGKNGKYSLISERGVIIYKPDNPNEWFDFVRDFEYGYCLIRKNDKYNFITQNGAILYNPDNPNEWFDEIDPYFYNGFAMAFKNGDVYYLREDGVLCDATQERNESKIGIGFPYSSLLSESNLHKIIMSEIVRLL